MYFKGDELREYFEKKLIININTIEAVYYFHICYLLKNKNKRDYCLKFYKNNAGKNLLLDSIIVETCNIKENQIQLGLICEKTRNQAYFSVAVAIEKTKVTIQ